MYAPEKESGHQSDEGQRLDDLEEILTLKTNSLNLIGEILGLSVKYGNGKAPLEIWFIVLRILKLKIGGAGTINGSGSPSNIK